VSRNHLDEALRLIRAHPDLASFVGRRQAAVVAADVGAFLLEEVRMELDREDDG
jgi:hypothetical protein